MHSQSLQKLLVVCLLTGSTTSCGSGSGRYSDPDYDSYLEQEEACPRIQELEDQLEEARAELGVLQDRKDQLQSSVQELRSNVDRLATENWRDVVPDIDVSAGDVEEETSQLENELYGAASVLEER